MTKTRLPTRREILQQIESLQDAAHIHMQAQARIMREKASLVQAYHLTRKDLEYGEHQKALDEIDEEIDHWQKQLKGLSK